MVFFLDLKFFPTLVVILVTCAISLSMSSSAKADTPDMGSKSVFVSYVNAATNPNLDHSPTINISFDGSDQYVPFIMDTGSVGIVASEDIFQPAPGAKKLGSGKQFYSSSGIIEEGTWWTATQNIYDADGNLLATSNVPVLQVKRIKCASNARDCSATHHPTGISVMGVGFGRESKTQPRGTPEYNAFLNLQSVLQSGALKPLPRDWCNGYVVTPTGVDLGLTSTNTVNAGWVKLMPWIQYSTPTLPEWMPATMTIDTNGVIGVGNILMDTGVTAGYLTPPPNANLGPLATCPGSSLDECVPSGKVIGIHLPDQANPVAFYTFTVGDSGNLMEPDGIHVEGKKTSVFFNTSRHVLGGINFIYDNSNGYIGYIWNGQSGSDVGYVIPASVITTTSLSSSANPAAFGKKITFTAKVVGDNSIIIPTGIVTFFLDNKLEDVVHLDKNGHATYSISFLPPLKHTIKAKYSGDSTFIRSSDTITQRINPPTCF